MEEENTHKLQEMQISAGLFEVYMLLVFKT